jgi:hypothetical protein
MSIEPQIVPAWARGEKRFYQALVGLAVVTSAGIAAAASNERRMFVLPALPVAYAAIAAPEPTDLRSPILGYLRDGCVPDMDIGSGSMGHVVDERDCGKGRKRPSRPPAAVMEEPAAAAFLAMPDMPVDLTDISLPVITELEPEPQSLPFFGANPFSGLVYPLSIGGPLALQDNVPEPATWAMMIGGFFLAGGVLRRRPRSVAPGASA